MIKKLLEYLFSLFRKPVKEEVKAAEKKPRKKYTSHKQERENFSDLLDGIESTFEGYKLPMESASWLNKDSVIGLKKLGAHVPNLGTPHTTPAFPMNSAWPIRLKGNCFGFVFF